MILEDKKEYKTVLRLGYVKTYPAAFCVGKERGLKGMVIFTGGFSKCDMLALIL